MTDRLNLVTGAFGFTGAQVVRLLLDRGERVVATDLTRALESQEQRQILGHVGVELQHPKLELVAADLLQPQSLARLLDRPITRVFHTASLYDYSAPLDRLMRVNVEGTRALLDALAGRPLERFVHWSTCGVFGKPYTAADGVRANIPFEEESPSPKSAGPDDRQPHGTHLVNAYSVSKWEQEKLVWRAHREEGLPLTVVRPAPVYGPGSSYGHGGIILAIAAGLVPAIPADAKNYITTSVHVDDIAGFAVFAADHPQTLGEDYNVVDNSIISYHDFLHYIGLLTGRRMRDIPLLKLETMRPVMIGAAHLWRFLEQRFGVPRVRVLEIQSATYLSSSYWLSNRKTMALGYPYKYVDVREGLKDTVAWFRKVGWLTDRRQVLGVSAAGAKP